MSGPSSRIAALRALPEHRRNALLAQIEHGEGGLSVHRARRQSQIVRRHLLDGEPRAALCSEFGISPAQFYADQRDGVQRALDALVRSAESVPAHVHRAPLAGHPLIAQAGESRQAARTLASCAVAGGIAGLERVLLALEVGADLQCDPPAATSAHLRAVLAEAGDADRPYAEAALAVSAAYASATDGGDLTAAFERALRALRLCAQLDARASIVLARFSILMSPWLQSAGASALARASIEDAFSFIAERDDVPAAVRALAHANRAFIYSASPHTLARARSERESALALALRDALPRTMWVCLYLSVFENIWRGDAEAALDDARQLHASVEASSSQVWQRIARFRLSNAYSAVGRFDDAQRAIAPLGEHDANDSAFALQTCALAFRRARYAAALAQASHIAHRFGGQTPTFLANAMLYGAGAAYRLNDLSRARTNITDAVAVLETSAVPMLFITLQAFRLAHQITGLERHRDAANDLQAAFEALDITEPIESEAVRLTPRQREIARLAAGGATNPAIAAAFGISARTVANHLASIFAAFGIRARWQLDLMRIDE